MSPTLGGQAAFSAEPWRKVRRDVWRGVRLGRKTALKKDAGRAWYLHLKSVLHSFGWIESSLEKAVFVLRGRPKGGVTGADAAVGAGAASARSAPFSRCRCFMPINLNHLVDLISPRTQSPYGRTVRLDID